MAEWQNPQTIAIWLGIVILVVVVLVITILLFSKIYYKRIIGEQEKLADVKIEHQKKLLANSILIQEHERTRIAADIHDDLISKLNIVKLGLQTQKPLSFTTNILDKSIHTARSISHDLSPPLIEEISLEELITDFLSPVQDKIHVIFHQYNPKRTEIPCHKKLQVFRIIQEVMNNILKHADATEIYFNLHISQNKLALLIKDNGVGYHVEQKKKGLGSKNIELRAQILKADYRFKSAINKGSSFIFYMNQIR